MVVTIMKSFVKIIENYSEMIKKDGFLVMDDCVIWSFHIANIKRCSLLWLFRCLKCGKR